MKRTIILAIVLLTAGCGSSERRKRTDLMNAVERNVKLPAGSKELASYARAYKFASQNRVSAYYFIPDGNFYQDCQATKAGGRTNGQIALACPPPDGINAGEHRWFDNDVELPFVSDGGCSFIEVDYDVERRSLISANCNGDA